MTDDAGYEGEIVLEAPENIGTPADIGVVTAKFVRYPGSQQLILWLPQSGYFGYGALRVFGPRERVIENTNVRARLNGSVQILTDTLAWAPGAYRIEIEHDGGWRHQLRLRKLEAGADAPVLPPPPTPTPDTAPIVYRDGFGNELPNVDLEMRDALLKRVAARFGRRLEFEGNARAGTIIYIEGETRIRFSHEMCGGRVNISVELPTPERWEAATGIPLADRSEIVAFVAHETQRIQASTWTYEIHDDRIDFVD